MYASFRKSSERIIENINHEAQTPPISGTTPPRPLQIIGRFP